MPGYDTCLRRGALIAFEGCDRSGKSTQSKQLLQYLKDEGHSVELWRFPDRSTYIGKTIDAYLSNSLDLGNQAIHLLFSANRWEKEAEMKRMLLAGTTLIVDRYVYSGTAYSAAKGLDLEWCKNSDKGLPLPDAVIYLDLLPDKAQGRGGYGAERHENLAFQYKVYDAYEKLKDITWHAVDASLNVEQVQCLVREICQKVLQEATKVTLGCL